VELLLQVVSKLVLLIQVMLLKSLVWELKINFYNYRSWCSVKSLIEVKLEIT
jgi:hypothetical protein